jgi:hypothetical protein
VNGCQFVCSPAAATRFSGALSSIALCAQEAHVLVRILSKLQYTRSQSCLAPTVSAIVAPRAPIGFGLLMLGFDRKIPPACKPPPIAIEKLNPQILIRAVNSSRFSAARRRRPNFRRSQLAEDGVHPYSGFRAIKKIATIRAS